MTVQERIDAIKTEQRTVDTQIQALDAKLAEQNAALDTLEEAYGMAGTPTRARR